VLPSETGKEFTRDFTTIVGGKGERLPEKKKNNRGSVARQGGVFDDQTISVDSRDMLPEREKESRTGERNAGGGGIKQKRIYVRRAKSTEGARGGAKVSLLLKKKLTPLGKKDKGTSSGEGTGIAAGASI